MAEFSPTTGVQASPDVIYCPFGDGQALLDLSTGKYFTVNAVGAFIWSRLATAATPADLVQQVLQQYDTSEAQCADDVHRLLSELAEAKLIRLADASA